MSAYQSLQQRFERIAAIQGAASILNWDMQTFMPEGGAETRGRHLAELGTIENELLTEPVVADLLREASQDGSLDVWQKANVREMQRRHRHETAVDPALRRALTIEGTRCGMVWRNARPANDFESYAPAQQRVFDLVREVAQQKSSAFGCDPYDALIDQFEPGMTAASIDRAFGPLREELPGIIDDALVRQSGDGTLSGGPFPIATQRALGVDVMRAIGFNFHHGRLDVSAHPFCGGLPADVRLTTRYRTDEWFSSLMGIVHETGHALYEQGLPHDWREQPAGQARSMSIHESQSLMWEMQVARSPQFLRWLAPMACEAFGVASSEWTPERLAAAAAHVERGFIRVDADECTYPAHVMLRFELEKRIVAGDVTVHDLPGLWSELLKELVGVEPPDHRRGCMQDIHWTDGAVGYFPSYTLGAMTAAQLFETYSTTREDARGDFALGRFAPLLTWLRESVHAEASVRDTESLVVRATGRPLEAGPFLRHLRTRYLDVA
jgi:carboxypeptidase Taq